MDNFLALLRVSVSLAFVLLLTYYFTRYLLPRLQNMRPNGRAGMQVIERTTLGMRSSLCLVRVGKRYLVVGVTPTQVELIAEINSEDLEFAEHEAALVPDFARMLKASKDTLSRLGRRGGMDDNDERMDK